MGRVAGGIQDGFDENGFAETCSTPNLFDDAKRVPQRRTCSTKTGSTKRVRQNAFDEDGFDEDGVEENGLEKDRFTRNGCWAMVLSSGP